MNYFRRVDLTNQFGQSAAKLTHGEGKKTERQDINVFVRKLKNNDRHVTVNNDSTITYDDALSFVSESTSNRDFLSIGSSNLRKGVSVNNRENHESIINDVGDQDSSCNSLKKNNELLAENKK